MKLDTSVVIFHVSVSLESEVESSLFHFIGCYVQCDYMILSTIYNKLQMALSFLQKVLRSNMYFLVSVF